MLKYFTNDNKFSKASLLGTPPLLPSAPLKPEIYYELTNMVESYM